MYQQCVFYKYFFSSVQSVFIHFNPYLNNVFSIYVHVCSIKSFLAYIYTSQNLFQHSVLKFALLNWWWMRKSPYGPVLSVMNLLLFIRSTLHWWFTGFELDLYCSKMMIKTEKRLKCSGFFLLSSFYNE